MPGGGGLSRSLKVVLTSYREEAGSSASTMSAVAQLARLVLPLDNPSHVGSANAAQRSHMRPTRRGADAE
eukprot:CAMPEP_0202803302 /NCGR_PEP_ID=MMETSP1388-20130828/103069_1 /ASSEMBLY_ACC=CAM_ASM_000864 /TAXON_ID=37098 /ORGANISM="Isochrysis sp, Strain CCMP1244" /LENGTH=69 /DNA_ID=CAMNT_0049473293 /DNA_START=572 /DNA_END=781 /DNA_ORIENTATION=+